MLSVERRSFLSGEHRQLGWIEIPSTAPLHIQNRIVEWRHANIEKASKPKQAVGTEARRQRADALLAAIAQEESEENVTRLKLRYSSLFL